MSMVAIRIMVVEDEALIALQLTRALTRDGFDVPHPVAAGEEAVVAARTGDYDVIIMDITLRGAMDGIEAARAIGAFSGAKIIFTSGHSDDETMRRVRDFHSAGFYSKPVDIEELKKTIRRIM